MSNTPFEFGTENQSIYQVHARREIIKILEGIVAQRQLVSLSVQDGAQMVLTRLLALDEQHNRIYLDCTQDAHANQRIIASADIFFETTLNKVRISFNATQITACSHEGSDALCINIPAMLIRLQRREFFRVNTPLTHPILCHIPFADGSQTFSLVDISCGGVALLDDARRLEINQPHVYDHCQIDLGDTGSLNMSLEVRNSQDLVLLNGKSSRRVGCQFTKEPPGMLTTVQRYIMHLERERNARLNDLI